MAELLLNRIRGRGQLSLTLQRLLRVALLGVPRQVVLATEALGAVRTQEVLAPGVDHQVTPDVLARVEAPVAVGAGVAPLARHPPHRGLAGVAPQVLQKRGGALAAQQAHLGKKRKAQWLRGRGASRMRVRVRCGESGWRRKRKEPTGTRHGAGNSN